MFIDILLVLKLKNILYCIEEYEYCQIALYTILNQFTVHLQPCQALDSNVLNSFGSFKLAFQKIFVTAFPME